jgi:hypothetical protein
MSEREERGEHLFRKNIEENRHGRYLLRDHLLLAGEPGIDLVKGILRSCRLFYILAIRLSTMKTKPGATKAPPALHR